LRDCSIVKRSGAGLFATQAEDTVTPVISRAAMKASILVIACLLLFSGQSSPVRAIGALKNQSLGSVQWVSRG
jgi:hypothetical protein